MPDQYIIQKTASGARLELVSEYDVFGGLYSMEELAVFPDKESAHNAIRRLIDMTPNAAPYKAIRMTFEDE